MAARVFQLRYEELPATLPVFPLSGVLLLPEGRLPLNIFEPRYLAMVEDALSKPRLIGMIQPSDPAATNSLPGTPSVVMTGAAEPALYDTGCAGRIISFAETGDGRFAITLAGMCRFRVAREIDGAHGYRRVTPDWKPFRADMEPPKDEPKLDRAKLLTALRAYLALNEMDVDWGAIEGTPDAALAIVLPMSCPFEPREKQALLECRTPAERGAMLITLLEMAVAEGKGGGAMVKQ
jgi:Lon protease-like protein